MEFFSSVGHYSRINFQLRVMKWIDILACIIFSLSLPISESIFLEHLAYMYFLQYYIQFLLSTMIMDVLGRNEF